MTMTVPSRYKCRFPHILARGTMRKPANATPSKWYPVSKAISVKFLWNRRVRVKVSAARRGERVAAITEAMERIRTMRSRCHIGQFCHHQSVLIVVLFLYMNARIPAGHSDRRRVEERAGSDPWDRI